MNIASIETEVVAVTLRLEREEILALVDEVDTLIQRGMDRNRQLGRLAADLQHVWDLARREAKRVFPPGTSPTKESP